MRTAAVLLAAVALGGCAAGHTTAMPQPAGRPERHTTTTIWSAVPAALPLPVGGAPAQGRPQPSAPPAAQRTAAAFAVCWFSYNWQTDGTGRPGCRTSATAALAANWATAAADPGAAGRQGRHQTDRPILTSVVAADVTAGSVGFSVTASIDTTVDRQPAGAEPGFVQLRVVDTPAGWRVDEVTPP